MVDPSRHTRHNPARFWATGFRSARTRGYPRLDERYRPSTEGLLREFKLTADDLIVIHDDLDLEPGRLRIKQAGGDGGHNGIKSIIEALDTQQFVRLKIGIGRPAPHRDSADYVLEPFTNDELEVLTPCLDRAVDALECLIHRGTITAMNQFNVREKPTEEDGEEG